MEANLTGRQSTKKTGKLVVIAVLGVIFFHLGVWAGPIVKETINKPQNQGTAPVKTLTRTAKDPVISEIRLGDQLSDFPNLIYDYSELGLRWYFSRSPERSFDGIRIESLIYYGFLNDKLTAVFFKLGKPYPHEKVLPAHELIDLLNERYGEFTLYDDNYSYTYEWEGDGIYAAVYGGETTDLNVVITTHDFGINKLAPNIR